MEDYTLRMGLYTWTRGTRRIFLAALLLISSWTFLAEISPGTLSRDDPVAPPVSFRLLWHAKLAPLGLRSDWANLVSGHSFTRTEYDLVTFLDDDFLIVSFPVYEGRKPPARRIFRVVLLDARTGTALRTKDWLVLQRELGLQATRAGKLAVHTREKLELYSQAFEKIAEYPLPDIRRPVKWEDWEVHATPNRERLVVAHFLDRELTLDWLDSGTFVSEKHWHAPSGEFGLGADKDKDKIRDASNNRIAAVRVESPVEEYGALAADCHVFVGDGDRPLRKILERPRSCPVWGAGGAQWANEEVLFLPTLQGFLLFDADGRELLAETMGKNELAYYGRASLNGRWFVVPIVQWKGGFDLLDIGPHLVLKRLQIYEISDELRVLRHSDAKLNTKNVVTFALSPDGTRLAIVRGSDIELYAAQGPR